MLPDLEQLIRLQRVELAVSEARAQIEAVPSRVLALEERLTGCEGELAQVKQQYEDHRAARQTLENELGEIQTRLSRYRDQLMAVKTNKEYQAMQREISSNEEEARRLEDRILERMLDGDELTAAVKAAETRLAEERTAIDSERDQLEQERIQLEQRLTALGRERAELAAGIPDQVLSLFDMLVRRRGVAVVAARDGLCSSCRVRLRPQLFNDIRLNERVIQCESCQRILYFDQQTTATGSGAAG